MNIELLKKYVEEGYITSTKHPKYDLWIYNYTNKTQYERFWNEITEQCRGLVLDDNYNVIAKSFKKFRNIEEETELPNEHFEVFSKMDGSLIILFNYNNEWITATKASFQSDQAIWAKEMLEEKYDLTCADKNYTYIYELIKKENRIVVDYKDREELILLTVINNRSGNELTHRFCKEIAEDINCEIVSSYDGINDYTALKALIQDHEEGFVVRFIPSNKRIKIKGEEYCRLHRILTGVSSRNIWEYLSEGRDFNEIIDRVPDEFYNWVKSVVEDLEHKHHVIYSTALNDFDSIRYGSINKRAQFAEKAKQCTYPHLVFRLYDNKPLDKEIWKMIYPKHELPFKKEKE